MPTDREPCPWCADTGRVHVAVGPPVRCTACRPSPMNFAIEVAADALGLLVFVIVGAGLWGPTTQRLERFDRATRGCLDPLFDLTVRCRKRERGHADKA